MLVSRFLRNSLCNSYRLFRCSTFNSVKVTGISVHTTPKIGKLFLDLENKYAHEVLEQSMKPYQLFRVDEEEKLSKEVADNTSNKLPDSVINPNIESPAIYIDDLYNDYLSLINYCAKTSTRISDSRFNKFVELFCEESHRLTDDQLVRAVQQLVHLPEEESVKAPNYVELWNALDAECCHRMEEWKTDKMLFVCDIWYTLHLGRISDFVEEAIRRLGRKVRKMKPEQLVHTMFFCNLMRRQIYDMFDFEDNLAKCANQMSLKELGVMSMGFFKTQTPIRNPDLLEHLYRRLIAELDTVEDITLVSIIKVLRYSSKLQQVDVMMEVMKGLCDQVGRLSLLSCLHVALLGSDLQCCHDPLLEKIIERFNRDIDQARLKDLERICFAISLFNFSSPNHIEDELFENVITAIRSKINEIVLHPRCFPICLHYLTIKGHYDTEMLTTALDMRFIRHTYGKNLVLGREIFQLDSFVKINIPNYKGFHLPEKYRRTMGKVLTNYMPERNSKFKLNTTDRILMEIKETMDRLHRHNEFKHILPHFERPDIVMCYDTGKRISLPLTNTCPEDYSGAILTRTEMLGSDPSSNVVTVAIVVEGWNNVVRDKNRNTGLFAMKLKQLELLGHKYIVINWHKWRELETQKDKQNFLKRQLATIAVL